MIVDKTGKVVATVSQPTFIFETEEAYNTWKATIPSGVPESNFNITKKWELVEIIYPDLVSLKEIPSTQKVDGKVYKINHLCGTLTQEVSLRYDADKDWFVPLTQPIVMDLANYDEFIHLFEEKDEFDLYKLFFDLYMYECRLIILTHGAYQGHFKANGTMYVDFSVILPDFKDYSDLETFLIDFSSYYFRGVSEVMGFDNPSEVTMIPLGLPLFNQAATDNYKDFCNPIVKIGVQVQEAETPDFKWNDRALMETEEDGNIEIRFSGLAGNPGTDPFRCPVWGFFKDDQFEVIGFSGFPVKIS